MLNTLLGASRKYKMIDSMYNILLYKWEKKKGGYLHMYKISPERDFYRL